MRPSKIRRSTLGIPKIILAQNQKNLLHGISHFRSTLSQSCQILYAYQQCWNLSHIFYNKVWQALF